MRADFSLDYDVLTVERPQKLYLMARFEAGESPDERSRRPLNLSLVIDRSGSMAGDKIDYTRQAAQFLVQHLSPRDTLSLVLYNDKVETLFAPEAISNKDKISQLIDRIKVRGTTNLSGGWLQGCQHVAEKLSNETLNRVILMSDGLANRGVVDQNQLVMMARQKREEGVSTTTMGLGTDFNEDLLIEMANAGGGAYYFIESPEVAPDIFREELAGLLRVVGQNLQVRIQPTEHVDSVTQLNAYPAEHTGSQTTFKLGDIFGNEVKTVVLELEIPTLHTIGETTIAHLYFEYDEVVGNHTHHRVRDMPVVVNIRPQDAARPLPNPIVEESVLLLRAARARQDAVKAADNGDYDQASRILREVAEKIESAHIQNEQLTEEQQALIEQAEQLEDAPDSYGEYSRKTMSTQAFYTMTDRHDETVVLRLREHQRAGGKDAEDVEIDLNMASDDRLTDKRRTSSHDPLKVEPPVERPVERQPGVAPTHFRWDGQLFEIDESLIRLGRSSHNEVVINTPGISRFHAQIRRLDGVITIEDVGSTNGTAVNGTPISEPYTLSVGDVVHLSDQKLVFLQNEDSV